MDPNGLTDSRWLSADPLGGDISNPQSLNRYAYALNSPVTLTDPSGLCAAFNYSYEDDNGNYVIHRDDGPCPPDDWGLTNICVFSGYLCGYSGSSGWRFPPSSGGGSGGGSGSPSPKPAPQDKGFTLGLRFPNQTFN